jgi:hypothetical protein
LKAIDRVSTKLTKATAHLPGKAIEEWSIAELLQDGARFGLMRLREFASRICDETDPNAKERHGREQQLILNASTTVAKLLANEQMDAMRRKADEQHMATFIPTVDAFEAQLYGPTAVTEKRQRAKAAERAAKEPAK